MTPDYKIAPVNPLPAVVWLLVLPIAAVEIVLAVTAGIGSNTFVGWRSQAIEATAFSGLLWDRMIEVGDYSPRNLLRLVSYVFVQWNYVQALFVCVFTLALGKYVGEIYRWWAVAVVFFFSAAVGAVAYGALLDVQLPLVGGYPAAYGLIGALTFIIWTRLGAEGVNRARAFLFIGALMVWQLGFGAVEFLYYGQTDFYFVAELAGFAAGFLISFVVSPGGWRRVLAKLRQG